MSTNDSRPIVLFVCHTAQRGGGELALLRYARMRPHSDCTFLFMEDGPLARAVQELQPSTIIEPAQSTRQAIQVINSVSRRLNPALIVSNSMRAALFVGLSTVKRNRHVYYVRDFVGANHLSPWKRYAAILTMLFRVGGVIANSGATLESVPSARLRRGGVVAHSCAGVSKQSIERCQGQPYVPKSRLKILSLSRISPWKGQETLLDALRLLSKCRSDASEIELTIAGTALFGEEEFERRLHSIAAKINYRIRFVGHVDDVDSLLATHDVLAHTSTSPEPFGQVIIQGLGAGLTVVSSAGGGAEEIMNSSDQQSGWVWDGKTPESLAACIAEVLEDQVLAEKRRTIGFMTALKYSDENAAITLDYALQKFRQAETASS